MKSAALGRADVQCSDSRLSLSEDVLRLVLNFVSMGDLSACAQVSKRWNALLSRNDDILWSWRSQNTYWQNRYGTRELLQKRIQDRNHLVSKLERGQFVQHCDGQRSWLLCGHSKTVMDMTILDFEGFRTVITCSADGEIRSWLLPIESNRPPSTLLIKLGESKNFVPGGVEWIEKAQNEGSTSHRLFVCGRKRLYFLEIETTDFNGLTGQNAPSKLSCTLLQSAELNYYVTCTFLDSVNLKFLMGSSDSIIRVYDVVGDCLAPACAVDVTKPLLLIGHTSSVQSLSLASNGSLLYSRSSDQTVRVWNHLTGECRATIDFDGSIGGIQFLGFSQDSMAVFYDSLDICSVKICDICSGKLTQEITTQARISAIYLQEHSLLCGTVDGSIVGFNLNDGGRQEIFLPHVLESCIAIINWLVSFNWILAITDTGDMCLIRLLSQGTREGGFDYEIVRRISLRFRNPTGIVFSNDDNALLVASSGYLVRAIVFKPEE